MGLKNKENTKNYSIFIYNLKDVVGLRRKNLVVKRKVPQYNM